jgi:hypothetical protein
MRLAKTSTLALLPAALIAQAPAPGISQLLRSEQPVIDKLVKDLKTQEALAKAEALIATPKPAYDNKDLNSVAQSQNTYRDLVSAHILAAKTAIAAGDWEKASKILEAGLALAKENQSLFNAGAKPTLDGWVKADTDAQKFLAEYPSKSQALKDDLAKFTAAKSDQEAIKKMNKEQRTALNEWAKKAQAEDEELAHLDADKKVHDGNAATAVKVKGFIDGINADCQSVVKIVSTSIEKNQARIKAQADEIKTFNGKQAEKKPAGKKKVAPITWVEAVMNDHQNIEKLPVADQVGFLNRLLVLEPKNEKAQKTLANILAGKAPFEAEKKPAAKGKKR